MFWLTDEPGIELVKKYQSLTYAKNIISEDGLQITVEDDLVTGGSRVSNVQCYWCVQERNHQRMLRYIWGLPDEDY